MERTVFSLVFDQFLDLFAKYGLIFVAVVCFCEYLNLPGFPAGIVMPALGVLAHQSELNIFVAITISIVSGLAASLLLYAVARWGGKPIIHKLCGKSEKLQQVVARSEAWLARRCVQALVISRLIPVARTIISVPAGLLAIPVDVYTLWSAVGIAVWNVVFIFAGYFGSSAFLTYWGV